LQKREKERESNRGQRFYRLPFWSAKKKEGEKRYRGRRAVDIINLYSAQGGKERERREILRDKGVYDSLQRMCGEGKKKKKRTHIPSRCTSPTFQMDSPEKGGGGGEKAWKEGAVGLEAQRKKGWGCYPIMRGLLWGKEGGKKDVVSSEVKEIQKKKKKGINKPEYDAPGFCDVK